MNYLKIYNGYGADAGQMGSGSTTGNSGQIVSVSGTINGQSRNQAFTYDNVGRLATATGWGHGRDATIMTGKEIGRRCGTRLAAASSCKIR